MKILVAILIFGLIVLIHEFGHFVFARINGIEVQDFSIGLGPKLCGFRAFGTQFSLRLLPLGGACMMLGENEDQNTTDERSFYAKNVWQRISVLFAGPGFNFILAFLFAIIIIGMEGIDPAKVTGISANGPAAQAGMLEGDIITKIDGTGIDTGREIQSFFYYNEISKEPVNVTVLRDNEKKKMTLKPEKYDKYMLGFTYSGTETGAAEVLELSKGYPMEQAGLKVGDIITSVNGIEIKNGSKLSAYFNENPLSEEKIALTYKRGDEVFSAEITPKFGMSGYTLGFSYNLMREKTNAWETVKYAVNEVGFVITDTVKNVVRLFTGKLKSDEVGSVVAVVDVISDTYEEASKDGIRYVILNMLNITLLLSANIGVMNLLPLPALDGGKLLFCAIEVVRGKPVDREKEGMVHFIGFVLLMILMLFLIFNDVKNIFFLKK